MNAHFPNGPDLRELTVFGRQASVRARNLAQREAPPFVADAEVVAKADRAVQLITELWEGQREAATPSPTGASASGFLDERAQVRVRNLDFRLRRQNEIRLNQMRILERPLGALVRRRYPELVRFWLGPRPAATSGSPDERYQMYDSITRQLADPRSTYDRYAGAISIVTVAGKLDPLAAMPEGDARSGTFNLSIEDIHATGGHESLFRYAVDVKQTANAAPTIWAQFSQFYDQGSFGLAPTAVLPPLEPPIGRLVL